MDQVLEQRPAPEATPAIEATLNYFINDGTKIFTEAAGAGERDKRAGTIDPHKVVIHNGRLHGAEFELERQGFRFVRHDTRVTDFFDEAEVRRVYYPEMENLVKAESGASRVVVFDHTLRTGDDAHARATEDPRSGAARAQRLHRMVGAAARARHSARRSRRTAQAAFRHRASVAADPPSGRKLAARHVRRARDLARRSSSSRSGATPIASARPMPSSTIRTTNGSGSRACGATRRSCSRSSTRRKTAARAGPRIRPSTIRPRRPTRARARASRSARWRFSDPSFRKPRSGCPYVALPS